MKEQYIYISKHEDMIKMGGAVCLHLWCQIYSTVLC